MADAAVDPRGELSAAAAIARVRAILAEIEDLEPRLAAAGSGEVETTLLERTTELVEEAGRHLERLGRLTG